MKISEIVKREENNKDIILHKEGMFWRAYEKSATWFCDNIKSYQVTKKHFKVLNTYFRGFDAGLNLKSLSGWYSVDNGTDEFGFSALPGGFRSILVYFGYLGSDGYFWSSTEYDTSSAWIRGLVYYYDDVRRKGSN